VADLLEVQQGLTQLHALGLPAAVLGALAAARRPALLLPTAALVRAVAASLPPPHPFSPLDLPAPSCRCCLLFLCVLWFRWPTVLLSVP
jgi:hypothetical protein